MKMNIFKNNSKKSIKRKVLSLVATLAMTAGFAGQALADSGEVVTLGANLNASQKQAIKLLWCR